MTSNPYQSPTEPGQETRTSLETAAHGNTPSHRTLIGVFAIVLGIAFPLWTFWMAGEISVFLLVVACWVACPYLIICLTAGRVSTLPAATLLGFTLFAMAAFGVWAFDKVDEDAQGGLVLIFAPGYQLIGAVLAAIIVRVVDKWNVRTPIDS